jgi:hypothetical protein
MITARNPVKCAFPNPKLSSKLVASHIDIFLCAKYTKCSFGLAVFQNTANENEIFKYSVKHLVKSTVWPLK